MAKDNGYAGISCVVEISSNIGKVCELCTTPVGGGYKDGDIQDSINHYIEKHGYKLLHVGTETHHGEDGKPWHTTVAILGTAATPPTKTRANVASRKRS